ncbi:MAG TPA: hypothetical protein VE177_02820, partial [Candidatus Binatus sp.]|nr:hypothetical protein [Candidatus Binatus sp.]
MPTSMADADPAYMGHSLVDEIQHQSEPEWNVRSLDDVTVLTRVRSVTLFPESALSFWMPVDWLKASTESNSG